MASSARARWKNLAAVSLLVTVAGGCAHYVTPGRGADLRAVGVTRAPIPAEGGETSVVIQKALDRKPLAAFPTAIAVVRLQASGYSSRTAEGWGRGAYSIVTARDVESDTQLERLAKLPLVNGIAPINRLLLPSGLESDEELRRAAAELQADLLLIYTLDTTFRVRDFAKPLSVLTLGLSPNKRAYVLTTASAVLMDTRNGYIYGLAEATERNDRLASAWTTRDAIDGARRKTEVGAFEKLVGELEKMWGGVVKRYAASAASEEKKIGE